MKIDYLAGGGRTRTNTRGWQQRQGSILPSRQLKSQWKDYLAVDAEGGAVERYIQGHSKTDYPQNTHFSNEDPLAGLGPDR
jgi:hypothetical protein